MADLRASFHGRLSHRSDRERWLGCRVGGDGSHPVQGLSADAASPFFQSTLKRLQSAARFEEKLRDWQRLTFLQKVGLGVGLDAGLAKPRCRHWDIPQHAPVPQARRWISGAKFRHRRMSSPQMNRRHGQDLKRKLAELTYSFRPPGTRGSWVLHGAVQLRLIGLIDAA